MAAAISLPPLFSGVPIVGPDGIPSESFLHWWQIASGALTGEIGALAAAEAAQQAAQSASAAANSAASQAALAGSAAASASAIAQSVNNSYVTGLALASSDAGADATVTIGAHSRVYSTGRTIAVASGSLTGLTYGASLYVYYDDPAQIGGTVSYQSAGTIASAVATSTSPGRHFVGAIVAAVHLGSATAGIGALPASVALPAGFAYA